MRGEAGPAGEEPRRDPGKRAGNSVSAPRASGEGRHAVPEPRPRGEQEGTTEGSGNVSRGEPQRKGPEEPRARGTGSRSGLPSRVPGFDLRWERSPREFLFSAQLSRSTVDM